jgi:taurine dioxygenase
VHSATGRSLTFKPLSETIGAEIVGLDPENLTPDDRKALREAWARHHVLVLRETPLSEDVELDFATSFGKVRAGKPASGFVSSLASHPEIMVISNIRENGTLQGLLPDGEMDWHFDGLHQRTPYLGAVLHAIEVPKSGGETRFKNMCAVYRSLPEKLRERLDRLTAISVYDYNSTSRDTKVRDESAARAVHPVVRVHEESGEKALYVCRLMTERIVELPEADSDALLEELFGYIEAFPTYYEHRWKPGDTVIWDNRCVTHARNDFDPTERRFLKRVTIASS